MNSLDKKWKELLFAATMFGPNLIFVLVGAYLTDAINPIGLTANLDNWSLTGYSLVVPGMFGLTWALAKVFDESSIFRWPISPTISAQDGVAEDQCFWQALFLL